MNILVVAAHPDDEILGAGATLRRLADEGHDVYSTILCGNAAARFDRPDLAQFQADSRRAASAVGIKETLSYDFDNICFNVVPHLEMVRAVEGAILRFRPQWIFTHHSGDLNIDHRVCHETTMAAIMLPQRLSTEIPVTLIERVYTFEVLSSTDWAPTSLEPFRPNAFFNVAATLDVKVTAMEQFEGTLKPWPHSRSAENLRHLAALRGGSVGIEAAEAFMVMREVQ